MQEMKIDSVHQTAKTELKSWAGIAKKDITKKAFTANTDKKAVRSVNDIEKKGHDAFLFMVLGKMIMKYLVT